MSDLVLLKWAGTCWEHIGQAVWIENWCGCREGTLCHTTRTEVALVEHIRKVVWDEDWWCDCREGTLCHPTCTLSSKLWMCCTMASLTTSSPSLPSGLSPLLGRVAARGVCSPMHHCTRVAEGSAIDCNPVVLTVMTPQPALSQSVCLLLKEEFLMHAYHFGNFIEGSPNSDTPPTAGRATVMAPAVLWPPQWQWA